MRVKYIYISLFYLFLIPTNLVAQVDDEFWFVVPEMTTQHNPGGGEPTFFRITSVGDTVIVKIEMPARGDTLLKEFLLFSGESDFFDITHLIRTGYNPAILTSGTANQNNIIESGLNGQRGTVENRGIRIYSRPYNDENRNTKITAYCDRFNLNNKDIWSLKGKNGLGTNFTIPSQNIFDNRNYASEPKCYNAFDIVATTDATTVSITPKQRIQHSGFIPNYYEKDVTFQVTLNRGETFSCVAMDRLVASHLGGSIVKANNPIAISLKDDSMVAGGVDTGGDQLIPDSLGGKEFIVMRGELTTAEYAFVTSVETGDTDITYTGGGTLTLSGRGDVDRIAFPAGVAGLHINSNKKILVWHVTGFNNEVGGAIVPSIDLCSGSKNVSVVRSVSTERFFLNIMTRTPYKGGFNIYIDSNTDGIYQAGEIHTLDPTWFDQVPGTDWWYLRKDKNEFTSDAVSPVGKKIEANNSTTKITNPGRFHLGIIEGGGTGAKYGYFSSFSADTGSASIGIEDKGIERYCYGDVIELKASGAVAYQWWYDGANQTENEFLTATNIEDPLARLKPATSIWESYKVRIEKDCYTPGHQFDTLDVEVQVYEEIEVIFDTIPLAGNCCSPVSYLVNNTPQNFTIYDWNIPNENDTVSYIGVQYSDTIEFTNTSDIPVDYNLRLVANKNYLCYDTLIKPITINPAIVGKANLSSKSGCNEVIPVEFDIIGATGPFTRVHWDWGDGSSQDFPRPPDPINDARYNHTYTNMSDLDVTYYAVATFFDDVNFCDSSSAPIPIYVPGVARARFTVSDSVGCSPHTVNFANTSWGTLNYVWDFDNGGALVTDFVSDTTLIFENNGTLPITFEINLQVERIKSDASGSCFHDTTKIITVYPEFETTIIPNDPLEGCNPHPVDFSQTTLPAVPNLQYSWDFGNGSSSGNPNPASKLFQHVEPIDKTYTVTLITTSEFNCKDTAPQVDVTVYAYVDALFTIDDTVGCSPLSIEVENITSPNSVNNLSWNIPENIGSDALSLIAPFTVQFQNTGDEPVFKTISLLNNNGHAGCDVAFTKNILVNPEFTADFTSSASLICHNGSITFTDASVFNNATPLTAGADITYYWEFGDGTTSSQESPAHVFKNTEKNGTTPQQFTVKLTVTAYGCTEVVSHVVEVYPEVKAVMSADAYQICTPGTVVLTRQTEGAASFTWSFDDGTPSIGISPYSWPVDHSMADPNVTETKVVTLTATNDMCTAVTTKNFVVHPHLLPSFTADVTSGCNPLTVNFNNTSTGGNNLSYHWDFADGSEGTYDRSAGFSHEFVNTTPANKVFTVELSATNAAGCTETFNSNITVLPFVDARFNVDRTVVCSPEPVQVTNATPANALVNSSVWDLGNGTGTPHATNPFEVSFVNLGTTPITDTIRLTNSNGTAACDVSFERVITINPEISPEFTRPAGTDTVCDNTSISFTNASYFTGVPASTITAATPTASFLWNFGDGSTSTSENPLKVFKNTSGSTGTTPQKYVISLTLSVNGCTQVFTDSVYVKPVVKAQLNTPETQLCNTSLISMTNNSVGAGSYLWEFSDGTPDVVRTDLSSVAFTASTTNVNDIQEIKVYLTASNGDCSHTDSLTLKVYPTVVPQIVPDIAAFCGPDTVSFSNTTLGGNATDNQLSYLWDFGDGSTSGSTAATVEHRFGNTSAADKVYTITLTATNPAGCSTSTTTQVTVYPEVTARFTLIKNSECHPVNVFLDNNSMNGTLYQWDFGYNGETLDTVARDFYKVFTHTNPDPNQPSTYTIWMKALDENHPQCSDSMSRQITIYPPMVPQFVVSDGDVVCYPEPTEFTNSSTGYDLSYIWDYRDGNTSSALDPVHTHLFENRTAADKTYEVKLMVFDGNGCSTTTTQNVVAHPRVIAGFTFKKDALDKCTPIPVAFTYPSSALNGNRFTWNFGDGTPQENFVTRNAFTHVFDNPDPNNPISYSISLRATDTTTGCYHDTTRNIRIFPRLLPQFDQNVLEGCNPLEVAFENQTTGMASYSWNFADNQTSIETDPVHVFTNLSLQNQDYNVVLTTSQDSTGCILTTDTVITVYSYVNAVFGLQAAAQEGTKSGTKATLVGGCTPFDAVITDSSKVNGSKLWDFGDLFSIADSTASKHYLTYLNNDNIAPLSDTTYIIKLKLSNNEGCMDSTSQSLIVYPRPVANFTGDLAGCHPFTTNIVNQSEANDSYNYYWELSDGSTIVSENFTHTFYNYNYEQPKIFTIKLTASSENECTASSVDQVTVYPKPLAVIVPDIDRNCSPFNVDLDNASKGTALSYYWDFDDGTGEHFVPSGANQQITLTNTSNAIQTYTVKLRTVTGFACSDTVEQPIIVYPEVRASFSPDATEGCSPIEISFTNTSSPVSSDGATVFNWNFGDAITSTNKNVMHRYVNETGDDQQYVVSLYAASVHGCDSSITDTITVYISPNAEFIVRNPIQLYPDTVFEFRNVAKEGPWSYNWNFGDGHSSTEDTREWFTHAYEKWGPKTNNFVDTVRFLIFSEHCSDESYQLITRRPPIPFIDIQNEAVRGCVPLAVDFSIMSEFGYEESIEWSFGDGEYTVEPEPYHLYDEAGTYFVRVEIKGDGGIFIDTAQIDVYPLPVPRFSITPTYVMLPDQKVQFYNTSFINWSNSEIFYQWDFGDGGTSTEQHPIYLYSVENIDGYPIKLVVTSDKGCMDSLTHDTRVIVDGSGSIEFPNAFLPVDGKMDGAYGDLSNDVFRPVHYGVRNYELWIFNRWGEQVYYSDDILVGWNGRYGNNGKLLEQDVYFWKAKGKFNNGAPFKKAGDLTLIRR